MQAKLINNKTHNGLSNFLKIYQVRIRKPSEIPLIAKPRYFEKWYLLNKIDKMPPNNANAIPIPKALQWLSVIYRNKYSAIEENPRKIADIIDTAVIFFTYLSP